MNDDSRSVLPGIGRMADPTAAAIINAAFTPGIGHNAPPLAEALADETKPFRDRAEALIASVNASKIDTPENAAQVTTLGGMLRDLRTKVETARKERAQPFDDGKAAVQAAFARGVIAPLDDAIDACKRMIDAWRSKLYEEEAAERRKRDAEAAEARRVAEEAEAARLAAETAGDTGAAITAEIKAMQAQERAEKLEGDAGTIRPDAMIRGVVGSAGSKVSRVPTVTDLRKCLAYLVKNHTVDLINVITPMVARLTRAKVEIPGVDVAEVSTTRFRR